MHKSLVKAGRSVIAPRVSLASPDLTGNEEKYVVEAIRSSWISSTGVFISRFENEFAAACGTRACLSVSNGTVALHLALLALGVGAGEEVIVPALTYVATANAVKYVGAVPVFVDVDPETWCIDPSKIEAAITERTRGIIAVHLYGHPADMDQINQIAATHNLWVVEDAAEAHFANYKGRPTGGLAKIGTFSFYGNKIITSGEGGAVRVWTHSDAIIFQSRDITFDLLMSLVQSCAHSWSDVTSLFSGGGRYIRSIMIAFTVFPALKCNQSRSGRRFRRGSFA
jgi:dTDP-4-amino-4,6-dideoxygalactose transaminase